MGMVAVGGFIPVGYYKDEAKSAATFRTIEGRRWSIPGDFATVNEDGTIHLLGRGSVCINTGGEKVFPEEVEEALKTHPSVRDAVVVGIPDERFGETICAVVEPVRRRRIDADSSSTPTSRPSSPRTRRRATSSWWTPSSEPPTARSTTRASRPSRPIESQVDLMRGDDLRSRLATGEPVLMPGVWDALSVRLAAEAGFDTTFLSGYCVSGTQLGLPDFGYLTQGEMAEVAQRVCRASLHRLSQVIESMQQFDCLPMTSADPRSSPLASTGRPPPERSGSDRPRDTWLKTQ